MDNSVEERIKGDIESNDVVLYIEKKSEEVHAIFGQIGTTRDLFENARFAVGFRHNMPSFGESATVWNVSGRWDITPALFVRGSVGTAFRLPTAERSLLSPLPSLSIQLHPT